VNYHWLLPEYIEDILPDQSWRVESLRRGLLDLFRGHGYRLVMPPLLEYVESLLTGTGHDMDLVTFKLVDQLSGRHMGLRADITPQAARIDAHLMNRQGVNRLCYAGSVLRTLPDDSLRTREPLQVGAELYGHPGIDGDVEVIRLMLAALDLCGVRAPLLDVGHVGVYRALSGRAGLDAETGARLFLALQNKDSAALADLTRACPAGVGEGLRLLPKLSGGADVLARARASLPDWPDIHRALDDLDEVCRAVAGRTAVSLDLAELRGYHYHSGIVFAAYATGWPDALAKGGRYDEVGRAFGRARPATGFSLDLRDVATNLPATADARAILAPAVADAALEEAVDALRASGEIVLRDLPGHEAHRAELGCDRELVRAEGRWVVKKLRGD
jgi:ATP phosphoribosyltransferase regulatory subunit